jgi:cobalamin biosynthesis protein CobD/CbiB
MNLLTSTTLVLAASSPDLKTLLVGFLVLIVVIAIIGGLMWAIEHFISPIPPPVKVIIAIVLVALLVIWAINMFL